LKVRLSPSPPSHRPLLPTTDILSQSIRLTPCVSCFFFLSWRRTRPSRNRRFGSEPHQDAYTMPGLQGTHGRAYPIHERPPPFLADPPDDVIFPFCSSPLILFPFPSLLPLRPLPPLSLLLPHSLAFLPSVPPTVAVPQRDLPHPSRYLQRPAWGRGRVGRRPARDRAVGAVREDVGGRGGGTGLTT
jgi:hypothetical protein